MNAFDSRVAEIDPEALHCVAIETLQVNLGRLCDLACSHCHLECSPQRTEIMDEKTMDRVVEAARRLDEARVDVTGGAPELHPRFRPFIAGLRHAGKDILVRTNLTALLGPGQEGIMEFLLENQVALAASLPCYTEENVRAQRGPGVFEKCIVALRRLNGLGYGCDGGLGLDLVYNPVGSFLPGEQAALERDYRAHLSDNHGITFHHLRTMTNMPIGRFGDRLEREGRRDDYMRDLEDGFNPGAVEGLMCRRQVCVDWDGRLYDCDFNLALGVTTNHEAPNHIEAFDRDKLIKRRIVTDKHCFGCTAGFGSSCGGALT